MFFCNLLQLHFKKYKYNFLIFNGEHIKVIKNKFAIAFDELADYFFVTEEFMIQKFKFMAKQKITWELDDKRTLCLHNLPSISILRGCKTNPLDVN